MAIRRTTRLAVAALCITLMAVRPIPALAAPPNHEQTPDTAGQDCGGLQRGHGIRSATAPQVDCVEPPAPAPERVSDRGGPGLGGIIGAVIAVLVGVLVAKALTGSKNASVNDLAEDGPRMPGKELLGQYEVQGLIYPNWPVVIELAADADATTFVQIVPAKGDDRKEAIPPMVISDAGGAPWGNRAVIRPVEFEQTERGVLAKFELPATLGHRGDDGFLSARLSVLSGRMEGDEFRYRPLDVLALGAGPSAVGSAALQITRFARAPARRRADYTVRWNAWVRYDRAQAELIRRTVRAGEVERDAVDEHDICFTPERRNLCLGGAVGALPYPRQGTWPLEDAKQLDPGRQYHMQLRAWGGKNTSGGWITNWAPGTVVFP